MPRILRIINRLNLGGPTFNAALLCRHLPAEYETLLVAGIRQDSEESSDFIVRNMGIEFRQLPEMQREINFFRDRSAYLKIRKLIREFQPDIVHTHAAKAGALGRLAAIHEKVPVVLHTFHGHVFHSYFHPIKTRLFLGIERHLARKTTGIIAISDQQKHELGTIYQVTEPEKINVVPLGFDLSPFRTDTERKRKTFRSNYQLADDELAIGIVGRLVPVKNHVLFLKAAAALLANTEQRIRFFIVGDGESKDELLKQARMLGIDHVFFPDEPRSAALTFTSWHKDVDVVMAGLDVVTLTSLNEGTPVSLIEAQAAGKPIISTRVGGIENAVDPDHTAILVDVNDTDAYIKSMETIIRSSELRQKLAANGWSFVKDRFHYSRLVKDMEALYRRSLGGNH